MRKILTMVAAVVLLAGCGKSGKEVPAYDQMGLNCKVQSILVTTYEAESRFGEVVKGDVDEWGTGEIYKAEFDANGNLVAWTDFYSDGEIFTKSVYIYNANGQKTEVVNYDDDGEVWDKEVYTYNDQGKELTRVRYDRHGTLRSRAEYVYHGEEVECVTYDPETESCISRLIQQYDQDGKLVSEVYSRGDKIIAKRSFVYDEQGRMIRQEAGSNVYTIEYNEHGLPRKSVNCFYGTSGWYESSANATYVYEYVYDQKGNWFTRTVYEGEAMIPLYIVEREINY